MDYPRFIGEYIWEVAPGVFTHTDETENFVGVEYRSFKAAEAALNKYCAELNGVES